MNNFDLQVHSTFSDGKHSPAEVVEMAKNKNLAVISLTDHDTVGGIEEALEAGGEFGVRVVPGIEISVEEHGAHILGYGIDFKNQKLLTELEKFKQARIKGAKEMVENLKNSGFAVEWRDVLKEAQSGLVARPHIVRAILNRPENREKLGGISTVHDFIEKYLSDDSPNYVKRAHISVADAIDLIRQSGGIAVWSHPAIHFKDDYEGLENFLHELIEKGIAGIEVFSSAQTEDDVEFLNGLTVKYRLLRTAGSDFHEKGESYRDPVSGLHSASSPGDYETYGFSTEDIISKLDEALKNIRPRSSENFIA